MRDNPAGDTTDQGRSPKGEQIADCRASHDAGSDHCPLVLDLTSKLRSGDDPKMVLGRRHRGRQRYQTQQPDKQKGSHPRLPATIGSSVIIRISRGETVTKTQPSSLSRLVSNSPRPSRTG